MTKSYSTDPGSSPKDEVRFRVRDVGSPPGTPAGMVLSDEEIDFLVLTHGSVAYALPWAARALAAEYADQADKTVGDTRIALSQKAEAYERMAKSFETMTDGGSSSLSDLPTISASEEMLCAKPFFTRWGP